MCVSVCVCVCVCMCVCVCVIHTDEMLGLEVEVRGLARGVGYMLDLDVRRIHSGRPQVYIEVSMKAAVCQYNCVRSVCVCSVVYMASDP